MFEECLYFNLNSLTRDVNRLWEAEFDKVGLSPAQGYLLALIIEKPGLLQKEIGSELNLERSTVTRMVDGLIAKGLIRREGAEADARASQVFPTKKGKGLHQGIEKARANLTEWGRKNIGVEKAKRLIAEIQNFQKEMKP